MKVSSSKISRRYFVPEVIQTSGMDCGPASLKCLLEGFGIRVSYGRLREACQTDVDGTSIDTMEEIARQLGLDAEQIMIPVDHLLLSAANALPAIVVMRNPNGETHFVVAWRHHRQVVQIMDPGTGRRWPATRRFLSEVYVHRLSVPAADWREWAGTNEFTNPLRQRLSQLGLATTKSDQFLSAALADASWQTLATLDAATRMVNAIVQSGGIKASPRASQVLERFFENARQESSQERYTIPAVYWSVQSTASTNEKEERLLLRGAVLVRARQLLSNNGAEAEPRETASAAVKKALSPELVAALEEPPARPEREFLNMLLKDGWSNPALMLMALFVTAVGFALEALILRSLMEVWEVLDLPSQRLGAMAVLIIFALALLFIQAPNIGNLLRFGRQLELRMRMAFLQKIPRLGDRYFQSRPISDMAMRSHVLHQFRALPLISGHFWQTLCELMLTVIGIAWIDPAGAPLAIVAATLAVAVPLAALPVLAEKDMRLRTYGGALGGFYLDTLLGLVPIRNHGAEHAVRTEHEGMLVEWVRANLGLYRMQIMMTGLQALTGFGLAAWILFGYLNRRAETSWVLLLAYWSLNLPVIGEEIAQLLQEYPFYRNNALRLLEPLGAPEEGKPEEKSEPVPAAASAPVHEKNFSGVALALQNVSIRVAGHAILHDLNFAIAAGSHVAIVGHSGAGKSSLVGMFLGWHRPASGQLFVDGKILDSARLKQLRQETAWVDPAVQLWNRSLFDNLHYGCDSPGALPLGMVIAQAELMGVLQKLPEGLQTPLGEGGGLVSGGEGQRVRLGRAMLRGKVRLAILDEPFRGLDREQRSTLLVRCRELWREATLLCITHDVGETLGFDRVLVIENGCVVDDGIPQELAERPDSRYHQLLQAENAVREKLWSDETWRKIWLGKQSGATSLEGQL